MAPPPRDLDVGRSVHDLCGRYPDLQDILRDLGFVDIVLPGMLSTVGRFMTLPRGAALKRIPWDTVRARLEEAGFRVEGDTADSKT